jgi:hypothetical protein
MSILSLKNVRFWIQRHFIQHMSKYIGWFSVLVVSFLFTDILSLNQNKLL